MQLSDRGQVRLQVIQSYEQLLRKVEAGHSRIKALGIITLVVSFLLIAAYFSQLILPFVSPTARFQTVDLLSPSLIVTEVILIVLACAWLYVGAVNTLFAARLGKSIREIRAMEKELEKRISP